MFYVGILDTENKSAWVAWSHKHWSKKNHILNHEMCNFIFNFLNEHILIEVKHTMENT